MRQTIGNLLRRNRVYIRTAAISTVCLLTVFKLIYPYPNMVLDSYYYALAAISHADVGPWAIGYSWFLRLVGVFSHSPLLLVIIQYLLLEACLLLLFLTLDQVFNIPKIAKWVLMVFFFANPLLLYCANFVMADALFVSLSLVWISLLLWLLIYPSPYLIWLHSILIFLVFCVRYNALYYPFVATIAILMSRLSITRKILAIGLQILIIGAFISYTSMRVGQISGQTQFSPFGNWKTANDALYMYGHVYQEDKDSVPPKFAALHNIVRYYFQHGGEVDNLLDFKSPFYGSIYMFMSGTPLVYYKMQQYGVDTEFVNFKKMAAVGPLYGEYGTLLIKRHPVAFLKYFVGPNAFRYLFPPLEAFGSLPPFYLRDDYLGDAGRQWFGVTTLTVGPGLINLRNVIFGPYQVIILLIHMAFLLSFLDFLFVQGTKRLSTQERRALLILGILWSFDLGFNLFAAATVLRYEIFLLMIELPLTLLFFGRIIFSAYGNHRETNPVQG